jgi:hypothetical protein
MWTRSCPAILRPKRRWARLGGNRAIGSESNRTKIGWMTTRVKICLSPARNALESRTGRRCADCGLALVRQPGFGLASRRKPGSSPFLVRKNRAVQLQFPTDDSRLLDVASFDRTARAAIQAALRETPCAPDAVDVGADYLIVYFAVATALCVYPVATAIALMVFVAVTLIAPVYFVDAVVGVVPLVV